VKHAEWGLLIVVYLFLGGLSAGMYFLSAVTTLLHSEKDSRFARIAHCGAMLAPWPVMIGTFLLIFDLGKWYRFYLLMTHFRWTSPMSLGSWLLLVFNLLSLMFLWSWLTQEQRGVLFAKLPRRLQALSRFDFDLSPWRRSLALAGVPVSVGVGIYTGVLLGAVQSRPFWNTNLVAQLFLVSAMSTGCAVLMLALVLRKQASAAEMQLLYVLDVAFMILEIFIIMPYVIHGQLSVQPVKDAMHLILGGPYTLIFWMCFVGIGLLLPLAIELYELLPMLVRRTEFHFDGMAVALTATLVLVGGFLLRYVFVYAGQLSTFD
jgi:formate-dependent nitrite reductase membrane component NrfD